MSVKMKSRVGMMGHFKVTKVYPDGTTETHYDERNLITESTKRKLIQSVYKTDDSDPVEDIVVGIGGTVDPEGRYPKSVTSDITQLFSQMLILEETTYTLPDPVSVTFLGDVRSSEMNGFLVSEAGLVTEDGTLFAYKAFPGIPKTDAFSVHIEWTITYP